MEKINNRKVREVESTYCNKYLDIYKQNKTFCILSRYKYTYLDSQEIFVDSQESLIYQFASELNIELELLDKETAILVSQFVFLTANNLKCINNKTFETLYHIFRPSSDKQWFEMIKSMNFEENIRNDFNKTINPEINALENVESLIKIEAENWKRLENSKLAEMCNSIFESKDNKAKSLCTVIIDTFILSFEKQNLISAEFKRKTNSFTEHPNLKESQCSIYMLLTKKMQIYVEKHKDHEKLIYEIQSYLTERSHQISPLFGMSPDYTVYLRSTFFSRESLDSFFKKTNKIFDVNDLLKGWL